MTTKVFAPAYSLRANTTSASLILLAGLVIGCTDSRLPTESATGGAASIVGSASVGSIAPTVDGSVLDGLFGPKDGIPDRVGDGSVVQILDVPRFEDRGIIEFDISTVSGSITRVELVLSVFGTMGPFPFTVDVFTYTGDGSLSLNDFSAGSFFTSFQYSGEATVTLDVTPFIRALAASGGGFAGFNFQFAVPSAIQSNGPFVAFSSLEFPPSASLDILVGGLIDIDIEPGSDANSINTNGKGFIPVAILGSDAFDANDVDATTLTFGPGEATPAHRAGGHLKDVNHDGFDDLVSHYRIQDTGLNPGDTEACVDGTTTSGTPIHGCDAVRIDGYTVQNLGTLGGASSLAFAVNAKNQVVGFSMTALGHRHAFLWDRGEMTDLGVLVGTESRAADINNRGQVVGFGVAPSGYAYAFLWQDGMMSDLGTLGGLGARAEAINERGQIVGSSGTVQGYNHAFLWENGVMQDLGTLGGTYSWAHDVSASGSVVGESTNAAGALRPFLWKNGVMQDLGTLAGPESSAEGINARGQVVGGSVTSAGPYHAFLWENGVMQDLGTLGGIFSQAFDINDRGQIVGWSQDSNGNSHSFLWENGAMTDLGPPAGAMSVGARGLNNRGWIAGFVGNTAALWMR